MFYKSSPNEAAHAFLLLAWCRDGQLCLVGMDSTFRQVWNSQHPRAKTTTVPDSTRIVSRQHLNRGSVTLMPMDVIKDEMMDDVVELEDEHCFEGMSSSPSNTIESPETDDDNDFFFPYVSTRKICPQGIVLCLDLIGTITVCRKYRSRTNWVRCMIATDFLLPSRRRTWHVACVFSVVPIPWRIRCAFISTWFSLVIIRSSLNYSFVSKCRQATSTSAWDLFKLVFNWCSIKAPTNTSIKDNCVSTDV